MPPKPRDPGRDALVYNPSRVSWVVSETIAMPPSTLARSALYFVLFLIVAAGVFAHFTEVSVTVAGAGMIRTSNKSVPVRITQPGRIAVLHVADGQTVKKDDVLVELEDQLDPATFEATQTLIKKLDALVKKGDTQESIREAGLLAQEPMRLTMNALVRERGTLADTINELYSAQRALGEVGAMSAGEAAEANIAAEKIKKIKEQHLETQLASELAELQATVTKAGAAMYGRRDVAVQKVRSARAALEVQIRSFEQAIQVHMKSQRILSPADGVLDKCTVTTVGELLTSGQILCEVIPAGGKLVAEVQIQNRDIAELEVGMPVLLRIDALPYQDYGVLPGHIAEIPRDAQVGSGGGPATYLVRISLDRTSLDAGKGSRQVLLGMTLFAEVQMRRRTLLSMILVEVLKLGDAL